MATTPAKRTTKKKPATRRAPQPTGRPTRLDEIIAQRTNPETGATVDITVRDAILERLRTGGYREESARTAGINKQTLYDWIWRGTRARAAKVRGETVPAVEQQFGHFLDAIEEAEATAMLTDWTRLGTLAAGGIEKTTITEKVDAQGRVLERTTRTERTMPDANVLMWRLERRWPERFGRRLEVTGAEGGPIEVDVDDQRQRAKQLVADARRFQQQVADGVIDVPSVEIASGET